MRLVSRAGLAVAAGAVLAGAGLAACATGATPAAGLRHAQASHVKVVALGPAPRPGSRAGATAFARAIFSRMDLPGGARRLPRKPVPAVLQQPPLLGGGTASLDLYELFELPQSADTVAGFLTSHVPAGMSKFSVGSGGGPTGEFQEVSYAVKSVPAGLYEAQLVLTVTPGASGGSVLRADAEVLWYPPRSAAEYVDPVRYHVLRITVSMSGSKARTVRKVVTSLAVIAQLADALDRSPALASRTISCQIGGAYYQLWFAVSGHTRPVIAVSASEPPCEGVSMTVSGRLQPALQDAASLTGAVNRLLGVRPPA